jgi:hypothetical protein
VHIRRVITFLLGIWVGCNVLLGFLTLENIQSPKLVLNAPVQPAARLIEKLGPEPSRELLRHLAMEQTRRYLYYWGNAQIAIGIVVLILFIMASRTRMLPLMLTLGMLAFTLFQQFGLLPELTYASREADFPPASADFDLRTRVYSLAQFYIGSEAIKLIAAGVLVSYLFVFYAKTTTVRKRRSSDLAEIDG